MTEQSLHFDLVKGETEILKKTFEFIQTLAPLINERYELLSALEKLSKNLKTEQNEPKLS